MMGSIYESFSITELTLSTGLKTISLYPILDVHIKYSYTPGQYLLISNDNGQYMKGNLISYNETTNTIVVDVDIVVGSGNCNCWIINLSCI